MTASKKRDARISLVSLALLEGTGWYQTDTTLAEPLVWGLNEGCSFLDGSCIDKTTKTAAFAEFCDEIDEEYCTLDYRYKGECAVQSAKTCSSPSSENYFGDGTCALDTFADNCPYPIYYSNGDCQMAGDQYLNYDQVFGTSSRCFRGTLVKSDYTPDSSKNTFCLSYVVKSFH